MNMKAYAISDTGRRRSCNQDYMFASVEPVGIFPDLFLLADGMGGHRAGDLASKMAVEGFVEFSENARTMSPIQAMEDGLQYVNHIVYEKALSDPDYEGMGTTYVCCYMDGEQLYVENVGDSRLYIIGDGIRQVTQDHSFVAEMVRMGIITPEEALVHPERHVITRAVGTSDTVKADMFEVEIHPGEKVLMCSDGLYNMVPDNIIEDTVREMGMEEAAKALVQYANDAGGNDNITIIIVDPFDEEEA